MDMLILKDVVVLRNDTVVLNGINLTVTAGITVCIAPPGSGKTTLCETATGLHSPVKGMVEADCKISLAARDTALLSQLTVTENIKMLLTLHNNKAGALEILKMPGIEQISGAHYKLLTPLQKALSKIACAVATAAELIICDDLEAGLNTQDKQKLYDTIQMLGREHGYSFLIVSGDDTAASFADKAYALSDGKITEVEQ